MKLIIILSIMSVMYQDKSSILFDFSNSKNISEWYVVDDGVMGGRSQGEMSFNDVGNGHFRGYVTTENNGGFSSVRYAFNTKNVSKFKKVILKVKGDGKTYQFRLKSDSSMHYSYIQSFETSGSWETIKLSFNNFYPSYRGSTLDLPNYPGEMIEEIALFIGNKRKENFSLEIEKIYLE